MKTAKRAIAQLLLMFPAVLFIGALVLRKLQPLQTNGADRSAGRYVVLGATVDSLGAAHHSALCRAGHRLRHFGA